MFWSRSPTRLTRAAKARVRERLLARSRVDPTTIVALSVPIEADRLSARVLLDALAKAVGVDPGYFRIDDVLGTVLSVQKGELGAEWDAEWRRTPFGDMIAPFAYDLFYAFERVSDSAKVSSFYETLDPKPTSEEEWIDLIHSLSLGEFLRRLGPLVSRPYLSRPAARQA